MATDEQAAASGIDSKAAVRQGLIEWRDSAMKMDPPPWDGIILLSHAIWWLADHNEHLVPGEQHPIYGVKEK